MAKKSVSKRAPAEVGAAPSNGAPPSSEQSRLDESRDAARPWKTWGPYLSERQWGTVREDYSEGGDACQGSLFQAARVVRQRCDMNP